jgi:hypothetical protein
MRSDIGTTTIRVNQLQTKTILLQRQLDSQLQPLANNALQGIDTLGNSIVALFQALDNSVDTTSKQIATCKGQSKIVADRFNTLHARAVDILQKAGDVSTGFLYIVASSITKDSSPELRRGHKGSDRCGQLDEADWRDGEDLGCHAEIVQQTRQ